MSALANATTALYALLLEAFPSGVTLLHPDDGRAFQDFDFASGDVVARYYTPQLLTRTGMASCLATVDIAAHTAQASAERADDLLTALATTRAPSGGVQPRTTTMREAGFYRTNTQFTILVDTLS